MANGQWLMERGKLAVIHMEIHVFYGLTVIRQQVMIYP